MTRPSSDAAAKGWAATPERSNAFALRLMSWVALHCGRPLSRLLLHPISLYFLLFAPTPRRNARRFLDRALGRPASWLDIYRNIHAFTATILDRVYLLGNRMELFDVSLHDEALIDEALSDGRGAFLVGAHVGSFEVLRTLGAKRSGPPIAMVMYPDNARKINQALRAIAPDYEPQIIALGRSGSMLAVRDWLDGGGLAGILADRALPGESQRAGSIKLSFLGHQTFFSDAPFRLAALLGRKVIFMVGLYLGGARYDVRFSMLADFSQRVADPQQRELRVRAAVEAYVRKLEEVAREQPYNWFNFHDFWAED